MDGQARCVRHPERPALMPCTRCGTFVCSGCVVSGDICTDCKSRLFREGVPWSPEEKARASARKCMRRGSWFLRVVFATGGAAVLILAGAASGMIPSVTRWVGHALLAAASVSGLGAAGLGAWGYRRSSEGRPGPAVDGVFPGATAALMVATGLAPAVLAVFAVVRSLSAP